ncbi:MAG: DUF2634 domain-containing protein [Lachnospiraceae bacterium]|nr:DUF2634 domain-containing protein [Lachnospiraceae bacterium]
MSFLPNIIVENIEANGQQEYIDFILDKDTKKFTVIGNERESIISWVEWAIRINRYKYPIFPYNYGCELSDEIKGKVLNDEELKDIVEYCIVDCLKVFQWIDEVEVRNIKKENTKVSCRIIIKTIYGEEIDNEYNI